jgi:hypothetical protein
MLGLSELTVCQILRVDILWRVACSVKVYRIIRDWKEIQALEAMVSKDTSYPSQIAYLPRSHSSVLVQTPHRTLHQHASHSQQDKESWSGAFEDAHLIAPTAP